MIISIPVSALSKRIIETNYGTGIIRLKSSDLLFQQLTYRRLHTAESNSKLRKLLSERIELNVNTKFYREIKDGLPLVGKHLYTFHCREMMNYLEASGPHISIQKALRGFYLRYGIGEYDYPLDHAYRRWNRWKRNKKVKSEDFFGKKREWCASGNSQKKQAVSMVYLPRTLDYLDILINAVNYRARWNFGISERKFSKYLKIYCYHMYSGKSQDEISDLCQISRSNYYFSIAKAKEFFEKHEQLRAFVDKFVA